MFKRFVNSFGLLALLSGSAIAAVIPGHVPVAPGPADYPSVAAANLAPSAAATSFEHMVKGHMYRLRQTGYVSSFSLYLGTTTDVVGVQLKIWRKNGTPYTLVGQSEVFTSLTAHSINFFKLATPFSAQIGDYYSIRLTYTSAAGNNNLLKQAATRANTTFGATAKDTINESVLTYYVTSSATVSGANWEAESSLTNEVIRVRVNMKAPDVVFLGDSTTSGRFGTYSFADDAQALYFSTSGWPVQVAATEGLTFQTIGRSGRTTTNMLSEFSTYVGPLLPKYLVILTGVNDVNTGVSSNTIMTNILTLVTRAKTLNMQPIVLGILPEAPHGGSFTFYRKIDAINAALSTTVITSPYNATFVDTSSMGEFYATGDPGNLWALKSGYNTTTDFVHLSDTGNDALAAIVSSALNLTRRVESSPLENPTGGTITTDGQYTIHTFTTNSSFVVPQNVEVEYFLVGGGGGGGCYWGGGGGAGGLIYGTTTLSAGTYPVVIGAGGPGGTTAGTNNGTAGGTTTWNSLSAYGGGYGAYAEVGGNGSSGGGGGTTGAVGLAGGTGISGQGFGGGTAGTSGIGYPCGGGGGFSAAGANATSAQGGNGGDGIQISISGTPTSYGGGGGGGVRTGTGGTGGVGGGGAGGLGDAGSHDGTAGTANTGGGGGGGGGAGAAANGGAGGSGVFIVRYLTSTPGSLRHYPFSKTGAANQYPFDWR